MSTQMATATEVEGDTTVAVPPELESKLNDELASQGGENQTQPSVPQESQTPEIADEPELSPRETKRVQQLIPKLKEQTSRAAKAEQEASALREMVEQMRNGSSVSNQPILGNQPPASVPPWQQGQPTSQLGEEVTPEQLNQHIVNTADQMTDLKVRQLQEGWSKYETLKDDVSYIKEKYQPSSEVEKKIAGLYQKSGQNIRFKEFAESILSLHQAGAEAGKAEVTTKLIRQEAEGAVTPNAVSRKSGSSDPGSMTTEEMEAWLKANNQWDA